MGDTSYDRSITLLVDASASVFSSVAYFSPLLGGIIADSYLGKFKVRVEWSEEEAVVQLV